MTYAEGKIAIRTLESRGWTHIITLMSDNPDRRLNGDYGMLFTKEQQHGGTWQFWLNKDSYRNLPE